jgi:hypothetical protein
LAASALFLFVGCVNSKPNPTDAELSQRFREHENDFKALGALCRDNPQILRIGMNDAYVSENGSERRIRAKERYDFEAAPFHAIGGLLKTLGLRGGIWHCSETPDEILFYADCRGMPPGASCKGFVYSATGLQPLVQSLDVDPPSTLDAHKRAYKELGDGWYLLYEVWTAHGPAARCLTSA